MPIGTHPPETDLYLPRPAPGERWDAHVIHTHYFGFSVPDAAIGAFIYVRYHPQHGFIQGGVSICRGLDNVSVLDVDHLDFEITMDWPTIEGNTITTANGLRIEFVELGKIVRLTYAAPDGAARFDVLQEAVTPIIRRGAVAPGEDALARELGNEPGGMEQMMRVSGELELHGETFAVDGYQARDRSWSQVREERRGSIPLPPLGWSPMCFGEDFSFNQIGFEPADTDPAWLGLYDLPEGTPTHNWGWVYIDGEVRELASVRRTAFERHPDNFASLRQEIEATDETGASYRFKGEAVAIGPVPAWPNMNNAICIYRWEDEHGRVAHDSFQEIWFDKYQQAMVARRRAASAARA